MPENDPSVWYLLMLRAIAGLQRNDNTPATAYLQFVEKHRDRATAEQARVRLRKLANSDTFFECYKIINKIVNPNAYNAPVSLARPAKSNPSTGPGRGKAYARGVLA